MRVLHLISTLDTGGAEMMLAKLVAAPIKARPQWHVATMVPPGLAGRRIEAAGVPVTSLGMRQGLPNPMAVARLARLLRNWRPDVLQTWMYHADLLGALVSKLVPGMRLAWNIRCADMDLAQYSRLTRLTVRSCVWASRVPDVVVTNSSAAQRWHEGLGYRWRRAEVIPNGFDCDKFRPDPEARARMRAEWGVDDATDVVGIVARHDPMKGYDNFVPAAGLTLERRPHTVFVACGHDVTGDNPRLRAAIEDTGRPESFRLLGPRQDVEAVLAGCDISVSSSRTEAFSNAIGEAMACGLPCVVTDVGDSAFIVAETGVVVPPQDPRALADGIVDLLQDREGLAARGRAARARVIERFSIDEIATRYRSLYEGLASSPVSTRSTGSSM